jgi:hypothetical protein
MSSVFSILKNDQDRLTKAMGGLTVHGVEEDEDAMEE